MAQLDLHLGAHKTATSFLQGVLRSNDDMLKARGVYVPHHRQTRKFLTVPVQLKAYERLGQDWKTKFTDSELRGIVESYFMSVRQDGIDRVLLTDENFLGHCGHVVKSGILYSRKEIFLKVLKEFLPKEPDRIFMSVREYAKFFSAVYGQYLLDVRAEHFTPPDVFIDLVMRKYPNWANLTRTIREVFPNTEIVIWSYEEASKDWSKVVDALLDGRAGDDLKFNRRDVVRKSVSQDVYEAFKDVLAKEGAEAAINQLRTIREDMDTVSKRRLMVFSPKQQEKLQKRYDKHLRQIDEDIQGVVRIC